MLVENYSDSRQVNPVGFLAIFERAQAWNEQLHKVASRFFRKGHENSATQSMIKLTWLALGEDQAARSRRVEQLTAL